MRLRLHGATADIASLTMAREADTEPCGRADKMVVEVSAAGVNPSDVKAALGAMPHAVWPRAPGRDWAGVVVAGPPALIGQEVRGLRRGTRYSAGWLAWPEFAVGCKGRGAEAPQPQPGRGRLGRCAVHHGVGGAEPRRPSRRA